MKRGGETASRVCGDSLQGVLARLLFLSRRANCLSEDSFARNAIGAEGPSARDGRARAHMSPDRAIERILELSAEAHVKRREAAYGSAVFHNLTGAIVAYGKTLEVLSRLKREYYPSN